MKALINATVWNDPDFESLSTAAKLVVFWLWTNPGRDMCGCVRVSMKRLAFDTGIDNPAPALSEALDSGSYVRHKDRVWIGSWISRQIGQGDALKRNNMFKPLKKAAGEAPLEIRKRIYSRYPELIEESPLGAPTIDNQGALEAPWEGQGKEGIGKEGVEEGEEPEALPNRVNQFIEKLSLVYGTKAHLVSQEGRRAVYMRGITEEEAKEVVIFVRAHRKGKLKDAPAIAQTCSAALENIGNMVERAFAADLPKASDYRARPSPPVPDIPEPTPAERQKVKTLFDNFKANNKR